jgi:hypothetical protein
MKNQAANEIIFNRDEASAVEQNVTKSRKYVEALNGGQQALKDEYHAGPKDGLIGDD